MPPSPIGVSASREAVENVAPEEVLAWAADLGRVHLLNELRDLAGAPLADAVLEWLAARCGRRHLSLPSCSPPAGWKTSCRSVLAGRAVLACPAGSEPWVLLRVQQLQPRLTFRRISYCTGHSGEEVTRALLARDDDGADRRTGRVLARADVLVGELRAGSGVDLGLTCAAASLRDSPVLGEELRRAVARSSTKAIAESPDAVLVDAEALPAIEAALAKVQAHCPRTAPRRSSGRRAQPPACDLSGGLPLNRCSTPGFADGMRRHREYDAWVDRAYVDAWRGVDDESLAKGSAPSSTPYAFGETSTTRVRGRPRNASRMPKALPDDVILIEDLLRDVVVPLANEPRPVLLVVADGMSAAVATEIVDDIERRYDAWLECLPVDADRRSVGVSRAAVPDRGVPLQPPVWDARNRSARRRAHRFRLFHESARALRRAVPQAEPGVLRRRSRTRTRRSGPPSMTSTAPGRRLCPQHHRRRAGPIRPRDRLDCRCRVTPAAAPGACSAGRTDGRAHLRPRARRRAARRAGQFRCGHSSNRSRPASGGAEVTESGEVRVTGSTRADARRRRRAGRQ